MSRSRPSRKTPRTPAPPPAAVAAGLWWRAALIVLAGVLTYWNSLSGAFILDDQSTVVDNPQIRDLWNLGKVLAPERDTAIAGRPLVNLSFAINYAIGGLAVRGYHIANIAIHLTCALVAFGVIRRTIALPRVRERFSASAANVALAVTLLWTVHPLNSEVVDYLTERTESMMGMFYLLTLYCAIRSLGQQPTGPSPSGGAVRRKPDVTYDRGVQPDRQASVRGVRLQPDHSLRSHRGWQILAVISCALGMACKESMVTAPVLVAVYERLFVFDSVKQAFRARKRLYLGLAATWLVLAALNWSGPRAAVGGFSAGTSAWSYLLNQTAMITHYLRLAIWPQSLVVFYGWPLPLTLGGVWPYGLFLAALLLATIVAIKRRPMLGFLGVWFFVTLAPTSSIVPIATEVGAERRMYLPLLAVITLAVIAVRALSLLLIRTYYRRVGRVLSDPPGEPGPQDPAYAHVDPASRSSIGSGSPSYAGSGFSRTGRGTILAALLLLALTTALAAATIRRNREYASPLTIAQTVVERRPSGVAHHMLAEQLSLAGRHDEAVTHLREAVRAGNSRAGYLLGIELFNAGKLQEAVDQLDAFVRTSGRILNPRWLEPTQREVVVARGAIAQALAMQSKWPQAAEQAQAVLAVAPNNADARFLLANALFQQQRYEEAATHYRQYLKARPDDVNALINGGVTMVATGRLDEAIGLFRHAVEVDPRSPRPRQVLALALLDRGDFDGAAAQAREGLTLSANDPAMREAFGNALASALRGSAQRPKP